MHNFRELMIWKSARNIVKEIYKITKSFPKEELFGLTNQIRRCAVSMPSNIAEGCGRDSDKSLAYFLSVALGSSCEVETQLLLAYDLEYLSQNDCDKLVSEINKFQRMTRSFKKKFG